MPSWANKVRVEYYVQSVPAQYFLDAAFLNIGCEQTPKLQYNVFDATQLDFFTEMRNTTNPSLQIESNTYFYSGTLANNTESSAQDISGVSIGTINVTVNGGQSGMVRIVIQGTLDVNTSEILLVNSVDNAHSGNYYADFAIAPTSHILVLGDVNSTIAILSFHGMTLTFTVSATPGTASNTNVYVGDNGKPAVLEGATSWSYDLTSKMITITKIHSSDALATIQIRWKHGALDLLIFTLKSRRMDNQQMP